MRLKFFLIFIPVVFFVFYGCAGTPKTQVRSVDQQTLDRQIYEPYQARNTLEAYEEFIAQNPGNLFVADAKKQIYRLKYDEFLKKDTVSGYREFIEKNPDNPHTKEASKCSPYGLSAANTGFSCLKSVRFSTPTYKSQCLKYLVSWAFIIENAGNSESN